MEQGVRFKILYTEEALQFLSNLPEKASMYVLDNSLFKKLGSSDIWEFRTLFDGVAYRLFAFWDTEVDALVVATHGITKKSQKTPQKEIAKAIAKRKEYFNNKRQQQ